MQESWVFIDGGGCLSDACCLQPQSSTAVKRCAYPNRENRDRLPLENGLQTGSWYLSICTVILLEFPVKPQDKMGRKEGEDSRSWKKMTDNIQDTFEFLEMLGS
ncbi:UNVERIFIED_CONTAM: hypothetical protein FKN15_077334 [Acipenser sinensis]